MDQEIRSSAQNGKLESIRLKAISKTFPGVRALNNVFMEMRAGEVISIVGQNGAGKSTLMDVLGGVIQPDSGGIFFDETPVVFASPRDSMQKGVSYIHQELTLFNNLTVAENVMFNEYAVANPLRPLDRSAINRKCAEVLEMIEPSIKPGDLLASLTVGKKQIVEICRAIVSGASVIIFDEPTSSLTLKEKEGLYDLIGRLKRSGYVIIYITHHFEEIFRIADRIYVLRDGENAGEVQVADTNTTELTKLMLGEYAARMFANGDTGPDARLGDDRPALLEVRNLSSTTGLQDIDFTLRKREVLGIWGLLGSGRTELMRALLQIDPLTDGTVQIDTAEGMVPVPREFTTHFGYVPENRREEGLFLDAPILQNTSIGRIRSFANRLGLVNRTTERSKVEKVVKDLGVKLVDIHQRVDNLSGGNQQKVVIARWLIIKPDIIILDDPTKGLDIGAKSDVYRLINELVGEGISVLLVSSDIDEILHLSDRVLVLADKQVSAVLERDQIEKTTLMEHCVGQR
ncbi:sugar ABC transporter ATP-binding protein [Aliiruegeria sabulilitoris]|uniref:sugar ABC transporter ATP-binding protein n=1 Tax=Aliiruegeria sabulilitoris TaxID=1510458 RepID=UPI000833B245|nr:sugar ABC transporter ATP-binding protein [Aliiruegeria sabulilitoris]NDR55429.1 sugar ABC transporter ATP-binding protein [Pseudoruegeria sp. M32A2M]